MQTLIVIAVLVLLYFAFKLSGSKGKVKPGRKNSDKQQASASSRSIPDDLVEHWITVKQWKTEGSSPLPRWYFDEPTERQLERLKNEGMKAPNGAKKGHVSDLIGLTERPDDGQKEMLKFFKEPYGGLTQTGANIKIREIFSNPDNKVRWEQRPASQFQKEALKMLGIKAPKGFNHSEIDALLYGGDLTEQQEDELDAFGSIWDDLCNPEFRKEFEMKKPSFARYKQALTALDEQGEQWRDGDPYIVAEKLIDLFPELER